MAKVIDADYFAEEWQDANMSFQPTQKAARLNLSLGAKRYR